MRLGRGFEIEIEIEQTSTNTIPTFPAAAALITHSLRSAVGSGMYTTSTSGMARTASYPSTACGGVGKGTRAWHSSMNACARSWLREPTQTSVLHPESLMAFHILRAMVAVPVGR